MIGDKVFILNGDKPFIRNIGGKAYAFGGPFKGKEGFGQSGKYEIGGIYLLRRGNQNRIEDADSKEKLKALVGSTFMYEDISIRLKILEILQTLCSTVPINILYCNINEDAVNTVKNHIEKTL